MEILLDSDHEDEEIESWYAQQSAGVRIESFVDKVTKENALTNFCGMVWRVNK